MKKVILLALYMCFLGCTSDKDFEKGARQLKQDGYTNIENTGLEYFCCDEKDSFSTGFKAVSKDGDVVDGCFCSGLLKGVTIRFNQK